MAADVSRLNFVPARQLHRPVGTCMENATVSLYCLGNAGPEAGAPLGIGAKAGPIRDMFTGFQGTLDTNSMDSHAFEIPVRAILEILGSPFRRHTASYCNSR